MKSNKQPTNNANVGKQQKKPQKKIPKTVQESLPYLAVYPQSGIIETSQGCFSKSYALKDINYHISDELSQQDMFLRYGEFLNSFDVSIKFAITINSKSVSTTNLQDKVLIPYRGDGLDEYRSEFNDMLVSKLSEGKNNLTKEKYVTVQIEAETYKAAEAIFQRIDTEVFSNVKKIGDSEALPISTLKRLEILHDIYNQGNEGYFAHKINYQRGAQEIDILKALRKQGLTTKDCVGPESIEFKKDYMILGEKYGRALYMKTLPSYISDNILAELTSIDAAMLTTINLESILPHKANKIVRNQIMNIQADILQSQTKASQNGYSGELTSPEKRMALEEAEELLSDLTSKNQKAFLATFVFVVFADSLEELNKNTEIVIGTGRKYSCEIRKLNWQQEEGLASALPLAHNVVPAKRFLTTESTAVFMPFNTQELQQKNGIYYGVNAVSHNMLLFNRENSDNGNGFILGTSGAGKSFAAKQEMVTTLLSTNDDVIVIDPEREYGPLAKILGGQVIEIKAGGANHINAMDMDSGYGAGSSTALEAKTDFILSVCEVIIGGKFGLTPLQRSIIDRCCRLCYQRYEQTKDERDLPTLCDFQKLLEVQPEADAKEMAISFEMYTKGSLDVFAHKTNVNYNSRFVVFDIHELGKSMNTMTMLVILDNIWNHISKNRALGKRTWFYIDEIHLLLKNEISANFLQSLFKRARKYLGYPTGITQNIEDLLLSETARTMLQNSDFIQMLKQSPMDRAQLAGLLNISPTQLGYITNSNPGEGLIYTGKTIIPFVNKFPTNTKLYKAMSTKSSEKVQT